MALRIRGKEFRGIAYYRNIPMLLFIDGDNNIVKRKKINLGSPSLNGLVIDPPSSFCSLGQTRVEKGVMEINALCEVRSVLFEVVLQPAKVENDQVIIQKFSLTPLFSL